MDRYYKILGLEFPSTRDEIRTRYYKLAHIHHPDKGGDAEKFSEISQAYNVLIQNGYWDVLAKEERKRGKPVPKEYATNNNIFFNDAGTEFWMQDLEGFVSYYWTGKPVIDYVSWRDLDTSSRSKDYADLSPRKLKNSVKILLT